MYQFSHFFLAFTLFLDSCPDLIILGKFYKTQVIIIKLSLVFVDSYPFYPITEETLGKLLSTLQLLIKKGSKELYKSVDLKINLKYRLKNVF